ncbi:MAG: DMT family transporter [Lutimaribacter sp.]
MSAHRPLLAMSLMLGFCLLAPLGDALAKILSHTISLAQLLLVRFGMQAVLLLPLVVLGRRPWRLTARQWWLMGLRSLLHIAAIAMMFAALRQLPLAETVAIVFVMPFLLLVLGRVFLNEAVGATQLAACLLGFGGTLLIIQPGMEIAGWSAVLPLMVALCFALFMLLTRSLAQNADPVALQALSALLATPMVGFGLVLAALWAPHAPAAPWPELSAQTAILLLGVGVLGTVAHLLVTWALRFAPSASLAPLQYLEIPVAAVLGLWIFGDWPNALAQLGIAISVSAGLFVMLQARAKPGQTQPAP